MSLVVSTSSAGLETASFKFKPHPTQPTSMATALKITALLNGLIAVGHAFKGIEMFVLNKTHFQTLPRVTMTPYQIGWFQGCALFSIVALLNFGWSTTGVDHTQDKMIAALVSGTYLCSSYFYRTVGDSAQWPTLVGGIAQIYAAFIA
ncbi:hypothetical protein TWF481_002488 [Arthrobotrys musiformis]|uniref:Uncharacterized protein n=1 Tax=Arthrobotrys musiformis TaxID=47236 RepID=A0AAV9VTC2_9PEZI